MARAAIHDLGYQRYAGGRRPQRTRWRVIARNQFAWSWQGWLRLKLWFISAIVATVVMGVLMYVSRQEIFEHLLSGSGLPVSFVDAIVPWSFEWLMRPAAMITMIATCATVSRDLKSRAFEFYFARPVSPKDYLLGKIGGTCLVLSMVLLGPLLLLALYRVGLSRSASEALEVAWVIPKALALGSISVLAFAIIPLGIGSLFSKPGQAVAAWAAGYWLFGTITRVIAQASGSGDLAALDISASLLAITHELYDVQPLIPQGFPSLATAIGALALLTVGALALLWYRVNGAAKHGLGGG